MPPERILIIDDHVGHLDMLSLLFERAGFVVEPARSGEEGLKILGAGPPDVVLTDLTMPGIDGVEVLRQVKAYAARAGRAIPVVVVTASDRVPDVVRVMREGADNYLKKPFDNEEMVLAVRRALETARLQEDNARLQVEVGQRYQLGNFVGTSKRMLEVYDHARQIMGTRITVLILGESGTGKDVLARAIHYGSDRRAHRFVPVNCGAVTESLFESEFFGHRKGSFTGAVGNKEGYFAAADKGTLFLDEVGELSASAQVKLLRVLQEHKFTPVGATEEQAVDVRIIAATNRDLEAQVKAGRFREDLYYRIAVVTVTMPPLRDHQDDIPQLVRHFVEKTTREFGKEVAGATPEALRMLERYPWPGNVRELEGVLQRAVALERGKLISPASLPERVQGALPVAPMEDEPTEELRRPGLGDDITRGDIDLEARVAAVEREYIERALRATNQNRTKAAKLLGISFRSLRYRLQKFGWDVGDDE